MDSFLYRPLLDDTPLVSYETLNSEDFTMDNLIEIHELISLKADIENQKIAIQQSNN